MPTRSSTSNEAISLMVGATLVIIAFVVSYIALQSVLSGRTAGIMSAKIVSIVNIVASRASCGGSSASAVGTFLA